MAFWTKQPQTKSFTINDLDRLLDIAVNGSIVDPYGSAYYRGVVKKIASTTRAIPRKYTTLSGVDIAEEDLPLSINVSNLLSQSSFALTRFGRAYWGLDTQGSRITRVRWYNPATITENIYPTTGLESFTRRAFQSDPSPMTYIYDPDTERVKYGEYGGLGWVWSLGMNEIGPGDTLDEDVSLPAKLLQWADEMMAMLFRRGGINKWVATAENGPGIDERKAIKDGLNRMLGGGVANSSNFEVVSSLLKFQQVGTNPSDLDMEQVNRGNMSDISAAALTPQMLLNPELASNKSVIDRITATWLSDVVFPHAEMIGDAMNFHIFEPSGFRMELQKESMGANQEDEAMRVASWAVLVQNGADPNTAAEMMGIKVPEGMELMAEKPEPQPEPINIIEQRPEPLMLEAGDMEDEEDIDDDEEDNAEMMKAAELTQFRKWYKKRGIGADVSKFTAHHIGDEDKTSVIAEICAADLWAAY